MRLSAVMVLPNGAKLEEGWCEMATVKRMMLGGAAKGLGKLNAQMGAQAQTQRAQMKSAPPMQSVGKAASAAAALRKLPMTPSRPGTAGPSPMQSAGRTVLGSPTVRAGMAGKSMMKKGGAVKKATKK